MSFRHLLISNLFLQLLDGFVSYQLLSIGVANLYFVCATTGFHRE